MTRLYKEFRKSGDASIRDVPLIEILGYTESNQHDVRYRSVLFFSGLQAHS